MRRVALMAKTSTPTLYQRFVDREALLQALRGNTRTALAREMLESVSPEDACKRYLRFAVRHAHEYELLMNGHRLHGKAERRGPIFHAVQSRLAQVFGGAPEMYAALAVQLWCLAHGTASLLIARGERGAAADQLREACRLACEAIVGQMLSARAQLKRTTGHTR